MALRKGSSASKKRSDLFLDLVLIKTFVLVCALGVFAVLAARGAALWVLPGKIAALETALGDARNPVVFLDVAIDGRDAGRLEIELFDAIAPRAAENFRGLCTGERDQRDRLQKTFEERARVEGVF